MIGKAVNKLTKEDVQIDEGRMKDIYTDMMHHATKKGYSSHKEFTSADYDTVGKQHGISGKELAVLAGHKTAAKVANEAVDTVKKDASGKVTSWSHEGDWKKSTDKKNPAGKVANLAGQALKKTQSLSKEEVEQIEEKAAQLGYSATRKDFQMVAKLIKGHESAEKRKELATHHAGIFAKQNPRFDHAKFMKAAGVNEEVEQEMSPYLKATLQVMDEAKIDDLRDAQKLRAATKSAYDKDYKADTSHPSITVNKGTAYGGAAQKDDVNSDENPIKKYDHGERGRPAGYKTGAGGYIHGKGKAGRPHGSKSGARLRGSKKDDDESGGIPTHTLHLPNSNK